MCLLHVRIEDDNRRSFRIWLGNAHHAREETLGIQVHNQYIEATQTKGCGQIDGRSGFSRPSFVVANREREHAEWIELHRAVAQVRA